MNCQISYEAMRRRSKRRGEMIAIEKIQYLEEVNSY